MSDDSRTCQMPYSERLTAIGNILANAILRQRRGNPPASKMDLLQSTSQSDTCAREAGLKVQELGDGAGRTGLAENLHAGEDV